MRSLCFSLSRAFFLLNQDFLANRAAIRSKRDVIAIHGVDFTGLIQESLRSPTLKNDILVQCNYRT